MPRYNGRDLTIDWDSTTLVGVQSKQVTINNEHVDVTTDDDAGWRTLLNDPGTRAIEVTVSGICEDEVMLADIMAASVTGLTLQTSLPTGTGTLSGTFVCSSHELSGEHDGAYEFSSTFMSSGAVTYTASI